jgi:transcriptional regulator
MFWNKRIKDLREDNDLTRAQLAKKLDISERTLSRYENGEYEPTIGILIKLSLMFNVSIDYIAGIKDDIEINDRSIKGDIERAIEIINRAIRDL